MLSLPRSRRTFAIATIVLLLIVATAAPGYEAVAQRMDDGALLLYPELILKGWLPYRDFETFYGPANVYLLAGVYAVFQPGIFVARTLGLFYHLAILAAIFCIVRSRGTALALGSLFIAHCFLLLTGLAPSPWLGGLACALWSLFLAAAHPGSRQMFCAGVLGAAALLFRPDLTPAVMFSAGLLLFFQTRGIRWNYLLGLGLGLLPLLVLICFAGFRNVFDNLFLYPVIFTNPARKLPWSSLQPYVIYLLVFHVIATAANLVAGFLALGKDKSLWSNRLFAAGAIFSLGTTHQALQRMDSGHVTLCCFLSLALLPVALAIIADRWSTSPPSPSRSLLFVAVTLLVALGLAPEIVPAVRHAIGLGGRSRKDDMVFLEHGGRRFPVESISMAHETGAVLDKLSSLASPGQRLFVGPADLRRSNYNDTFIYHLLPQLIPATYFLEMNPLSANRPESRLGADLAAADWLILDHGLDEWNEPNDSSRFGSDAPNRIVQSHFELRGKHGPFDIYGRK
ncbi:MAG TPA: hypothetical protein VGW39_15295 [Chthoniobacterales bacterium]|nr:hypothetical protein [Chthoniobacterales bacterium]